MIEWILLLGVGVNDIYAEEVARFKTENECRKAALVISREVTREKLLDRDVNAVNPKSITMMQIMKTENAITPRCYRKKSD